MEDNSQFRDRLLNSPYEVQGNRKGQVTVKNAVTQEVIRRFQMKEGVVREVFLLDKGKTVGASQKDHAVFWDLQTGQEIRRFKERIYGFSHDETKFFTYNQEGVFLFVYPTMNLTCKLAQGPMVGPEKFLFSPNDQFLVILFASGRPSSDEHYPASEAVLRGIRYTKLFNLKICREIENFSKFDIAQLGEFSNDSRFYDLKNTLVFTNNRYLKGSWRFDLRKNKIFLNH